MKKGKAPTLVSVIVNTVDRPEDLRRCLRAVWGQTYRHFELVVVNNGTGEKTRNLLRDFKLKYQKANKKIRIVEDNTKKLSYLFNVGWRNASPQAAIFAYCADDTEPDKNWLLNIVAYLEEHPRCGAVSGPTLSTTEPPGEMFALYDLMKKNFFTRLFLRLYEYFVLEDKTFQPGRWCQSGAFTMGAGIPQPKIKKPLEIELLTSGNMGVRREVMEEIGGFDENFCFNHADGDLFIRILKAGYKNIFHPKVKVWHHMRFGPTRFPEIMGRDTAFYYLKDVRPRSLRGWVGCFMNLGVFLSYWVFKAAQIRDPRQLRGIGGFVRGISDFFTTPTPERNELLKTAAVAAGFAALFAQAYRRLFFGGMLAYGDAVPFPETARQAFLTFFSAWDPRSPGISLPQIPVLSSLTLVEGVLIFLFRGKAVLAQRFFHWAPLPLAFVSLYWVLGRWVKSRTARFMASFIYSANLVAIGEVLGGFEGSLYVQAFFPLLLYLLYRFYSATKFDFKIILKFSILLSLAYLFSDHVFLFLIPFALLFVIFMARSGRLMSAVLFWLVATALVVFLTFFHTFYYLGLALPFLSGGLRGDVLEFLSRNVGDTYNYLTLGKALRVGGSYYLNLYGGSFFWARLGFILPLLAFSWFLFPKNRRGDRFWWGLFFTALSLLDVAFLVLAREKLLGLFRAFPVLFRFRNPARPWLFLAFCYAILTALTLDGFLAPLKRFSLRRKARRGGWIFRKRFRSLLLFLVFAVIACYYKPFFAGDFMMRKNRGEAFRIGRRYYKLARWLKEQRAREGFFRVLYLPWNHEETEVKLYWLDPYAYAVPINYGAYTQSLYLDQMKSVYRKLAAGETGTAGEKLALAGVKYVVLNLKSKETGKALYRYDYQTPWLLGSASAWEGIVFGVENLQPLTTVDGFRIYRNLSYSPKSVDRVLAGLPPENINRRRRTKNITLFITLLAWAGVSGALVRSRSRLD